MNYYHLNLGNTCNQKCGFCLVNGGKGYMLSFKEAREKLQRARRQEAVFLGIDGGEPTIAPYFPELIEESFLLGFKKIAIKTNGTGFSHYHLARKSLARQKENITIYLSLHGPSAEIHDKLVSERGGFGRALKAIQNLNKLGVRVICNLVVCSSNFLYLKEYIGLLNRLHIQETIFLFIIPKGRALKHSYLIPRIVDTLPFIKQAIDYANNLGIKVSLTFYPFCILGKYKNKTVEYHIKTDLNSFDQLYRDKYFARECQDCLYAKNCPRVWKKYIKFYPFVFAPNYK